MGADSFRADGQTNRHDEANSTFRSCVKSVEEDYLNFDHTYFSIVFKCLPINIPVNPQFIWPMDQALINGIIDSLFT